MFLSKILLMCIMIHGSRSGPRMFKLFKPIKIEDSQIPVSSVARPETDRKSAELFLTETRSSAFLKPIKIGPSKKPFQTETDSSPFFTPIELGLSEKKASFQVPVINQQVQNKIKGGPGRRTEQKSTPPKEADSPLPQESNSFLPQGSILFLPQESNSFLPQESNDLLPPVSNLFLPQKYNAVLPPGSNSFVRQETNTFLPQESNTFLVKSTTTPAPDTLKPIVQGFRVIGDPSNKVVFLDLKALEESGIDASSSTIHIGPDSLEIIEGLQTEAPTNQKLTKPASAPANLRLVIPAPAFVTKATATPPKSVIQSLKPSRLPDSIKKFSVSLKSDKAPVFFSRKVSTSPSLSTFPVKSVSSTPSLRTQGFSHFVKSVSQAGPRTPLRHATFVNTDHLTEGLVGQPDAGTSRLAFDSLVGDDPFGELESLKKFKVPVSISTTSSPHLSERGRTSFSTEEEFLHGTNLFLSLEQKHQQQLQQRLQQFSFQQGHPRHPQHLHQVRQEHGSLQGEHHHLYVGEETLKNVHHLLPLQQEPEIYSQHQQQLRDHHQQLQQVHRQEQDSLLREHEALSSEEETLHGVLDLRSLQQHNSRELQQLQQVRRQQDSIHEEHRHLFSGKDQQQLQQLPFHQQHERHPQHQQQLQQVQHLTLGEGTPKEGHHLLHPQHALHSQHQQQLQQHQKQLQQHQQQVEELKQQLQQLETQRQQQLKQLNQQEENVDRFSSLQEEEDALHSEFHQNLAEAFKLLG